MNRGVALLRVVVCGLAVLGCGLPAPQPSNAAPTGIAHASPVASSPLGSPPGSPPTPGQATPVASPGQPILPGMLACDGTGVSFAPSVLSDPGFAELGPNPPASALRRFLGTEAAAEGGLPAHGWRTVAIGAASVTFVAPGHDSWAFATFTQASDGGWEFDEGGNCDLTVRLDTSVGFATWRRDPAHPPHPTTTELTVLAREKACAGGAAPDGRLLAPIVLETDAAVTITLVVRRVPGDADCGGNPEVPVVVTLSRPLGTRALLDGSSYPARLA